MSLKPTPIEPVPEGTARVARAAFPGGNAYLRMRDELESLVEDRDVAHLFPRRGQPAERPWRARRAAWRSALLLAAISPSSPWRSSPAATQPTRCHRQRCWTT